MKLKKIGISIAILVILIAQSLTCFAVDPSGFTPNTEDNKLKGIVDIGADIVKVIQVIGTIASVGVVLVIGIKYMMGSAEEKAEYKKTMIPYLVGAILLFAATNIVGVIQSMKL